MEDLMMTATADILRATRDGWLASVSPDGLVPGPFLEPPDIAMLQDSTGWNGAHLAEAVRRAFSPFNDKELADMCEAGPGPNAGLVLLAILAGRVPALAVKVAFHCAAAGVHAAIKPSSLEPVFAGLLAKSFNRAGREGLLSLVPPGSPQATDHVRNAPLCLVYGSDLTVSTVVAGRSGKPTLTGPHMESFAVVFASAISTFEQARNVAEAIALDTVVYDQDGCLSPVAALVQEGGAVTVDRFAEMILDAMLASNLKPGRIEIDDLAALRMFEREATISGNIDSVIRSSVGIPPLVVLCDQVRKGPGMRTLQVASFAKGADSIPNLAAIVGHIEGRVQGMAVAGRAGQIDDMLKAFPRFSPNYLCDPGRMQDPPALWNENGYVLYRELMSPIDATAKGPITRPS